MSEMFEEEFLQQGADRSGADTNENVVNSDLGIVPFTVGIVKAGDAASREITKDVRVIWLPVSIVSLANDNRGDSVESTVNDPPFALVEVARILVEERWQKRCTEEG